MSGSQEGHALTIGDQQQVVPMTFLDHKNEQRLQARLKSSQGRALLVRITPAELSDVEGHALDAQSVWLNLQLEGGDTEGHAINVHFPTAADADKFRRNVLLAGILAGTIVIGSAGAIAITSQPATSTPIDQSEVYQAPALQGVDITTGINPATGKPWRSGFQERSDGVLTGPGDAALPQTPALKHPAGTGPLETVE